ncbi:hypothetical protein ACJIZ3_004710 [Penstemon smallii]|uniref:Uncharacterized protein n=1 Tax=Penstemon smallii TaxID=265156 RepID=A0ABD3S2T9_9LAMI
MAGACRRAVLLKSHVFGPNLVRNRLDSRPISDLISSPNGKRLYPVDTLALVRRLEAQGVPSKQAEAMTSAMTEVLNDSLDNVSYSFVSKAEMQKNEMTQESNLSQFKSQVKSSQDHHFSLLQHETEKLKSDIDKMTEKLKSDIEKMRSELRYEIDKVTAGQRLDLNLERGRIRDEMNNQSQETNKLDREIHALRAQLEAAKYEVIKYCIGTLASVSAVGLAVIRILM